MNDQQRERLERTLVVLEGQTRCIREEIINAYEFFAEPDTTPRDPAHRILFAEFQDVLDACNLLHEAWHEFGESIQTERAKRN